MYVCLASRLNVLKFYKSVKDILLELLYLFSRHTLSQMWFENKTSILELVGLFPLSVWLSIIQVIQFDCWRNSLSTRISYKFISLAITVWEKYSHIYQRIKVTGKSHDSNIYYSYREILSFYDNAKSWNLEKIYGSTADGCGFRNKLSH